jgi:hypothetical protein
MPDCNLPGVKLRRVFTDGNQLAFSKPAVLKKTLGLR